MSKPRPRNQLHILCCHDPDVDPRIVWTADAARQAGYDVVTAGWAADAEPDHVPAGTILRFTRGSAAKTLRWLLPQLLKIAGFNVVWTMALLGIPLALVWAVYALALMPWRLADYLLEKLGWHERLTRPVERRIIRMRAAIFLRVDRWLNGSITRLINGMKSYHWYIVPHAGAYARAYARWLEQRSDQIPDIIHANDPDSLLAAAIIKRIYGCRIVYDAHEYGPEAYIIHTEPRSIFFIYERLLMQHVDAAVTVSPQIAEKFRSRYDGQPHFEVVPNAPPLVARVNIDPQFALDEMARGRIRVLYQGGFAKNRGLEEIIEAWEGVNDRKACLFFRGPDNAYRPLLVELARRTGMLNRSIFFLPSASESKLVDAARHADIGLIPYLSHIENHEGACPNKLGQYMQAGVAIVSANLAFVRSILVAGECGLVYDDQTHGALTAVLNSLIADPDRCATMAVSGQAYADAHYNFDACFPVLDRLYQGCEQEVATLGPGIQNTPWRNLTHSTR